MSGPVLRIARIGLNAFDPDALARFFVDALGFERGGPDTVQLGDVPVDLHRVDPSAPPYPPDVPGWSSLFQHFAMIVPNMAVALRRLATSTGWTAISIDGPQTLPAEAGGVTAFKFRDPEGHPLEFLVLPDTVPSLRIDHSAISVADVARSIAFYGDLGLQVGPRTRNRGPAQQRLDAIADAEVDVVGLLPPAVAKPHVELLGYRGRHDRSGDVAGVEAVAATRLVLAVDGEAGMRTIVARHADRIVRADASTLLRDPDGHLLELVVESRFPHC